MPNCSIRCGKEGSEADSECNLIQGINPQQQNAALAYSRLKLVKGLTPIQPAGAFYIMVHVDMSKFPAIGDDLQFVETLVAEESVFCLPGICFDYPGYVRLVLAVSTDMLEEALDRIEHFCNRHHS